LVRTEVAIDSAPCAERRRVGEKFKHLFEFYRHQILPVERPFSQ
jgi:hypothetical protein